MVGGGPAVAGGGGGGGADEVGDPIEVGGGATVPVELGPEGRVVVDTRPVDRGLLDGVALRGVVGSAGTPVDPSARSTARVERRATPGGATRLAT